MEQKKVSRREILPTFLLSVAFIAVLYCAMNAIQEKYLTENTYIHSFVDILVGAMGGSQVHKIEWILADFTEPTFIAAPIASVLMVIGTFIAYALEKKNSPHKGTGVGGLSPIFVPLFFTSAIAIILGTLLFGSFFSSGWIPTFAAFLTVNGFVCFYGTDFKKILTILIYSVIVTFFVTFAILKWIITPLGVPLFLAVSIAVFIVVPIGTWLFNLCPWMTPPPPAPPAEGTRVPAEQAMTPGKWFVHQIFGDVGSLMVWGSSIGTIFMYIGAMIAWALNPLNPDFATGSFPTMLCAQLLTAALAIFLYYPTWKRDGMALTFASVVLTSAILATYPNHIVIVLLTVVVAAVIEQPLESLALKWFFKGQSHPIPFIQFGIFPATFVWSMIVKYAIMPLLGLA